MALGAAFLPPALLGLLAGWGVLRRRQWGRALAFVLAALALLLGLLWVCGGNGEPVDLALGGVQILYGIFATVVLTRRGAEFSRRTTQPPSIQPAAQVGLSS
jgi:peptidoglycan/LPS O-acetylase OafA/YrhL